MGCTFLKFEHLSALFGLVHCLTSHGLVKIHKPSVELGAVDAGELYLISYMNIPVPSTMIGFMDTMVGISSFLVS